MYLVSRTETFAKLFFIVSFAGLFMYIALAFYSFHTAFNKVSDIGVYQDRLKKYRELPVIMDRNGDDFKYILLWKSTDDDENPIGEGQNPFIDSNCGKINCFLTTNHTILNGEYTNFDAIIFNISSLRGWNKGNLPRNRSFKQKYIFHGMVPSEDHPLCSIYLENYFNWTWSYKLYSDIFTPFIEVKDLAGKVVAPRPDVLWMTGNKYESKYVGTPHALRISRGYANLSNIDEVNTKTKALVWVVNKCTTKFNRMLYARKLQLAMKQNSLVFDIYGCGYQECPEGGCIKAIEKDYYFYLAYEDSSSEDYVTDEVLKAYHHEAVPIVVGGADYSKFLPENSFIESRNYTPSQLAALMFYIIKQPPMYREFFNWRKYYTIHSVEPNRGLCDLCNRLHDISQTDFSSSYENFRKWWYYGSLRERCYPKGAESIKDVVSYIKDGNEEDH